jgi:hypothetical protein
LPILVMVTFPNVRFNVCCVCEAISTSFWDKERVQKQITGGKK